MFSYEEYEKLYNEIHKEEILDDKMKKILKDLEMIFIEKFDKSFFYKFIKKYYDTSLEWNITDEYFNLVLYIDKNRNGYKNRMEFIRIPIKDIKDKNPKDIDFNKYSTFATDPSCFTGFLDNWVISDLIRDLNGKKLY